MQSTPGQALPPAMLCQRSDPADIPFDSTAELEELSEVPGQERQHCLLHGLINRRRGVIVEINRIHNNL